MLNANSANVTVANNLVANNYNGITATQRPRLPSPDYGAHQVVNFDVYENTIREVTGRGVTGLTSIVGDPAFYDSMGNYFAANRYTLGCQSTNFVWAARLSQGCQPGLTTISDRPAMDGARDRVGCDDHTAVWFLASESAPKHGGTALTMNSTFVRP